MTLFFFKQLIFVVILVTFCQNIIANPYVVTFYKNKKIVIKPRYPANKGAKLAIVDKSGRLIASAVIVNSLAQSTLAAIKRGRPKNGARVMLLSEFLSLGATNTTLFVTHGDIALLGRLYLNDKNKKTEDFNLSVTSKVVGEKKEGRIFGRIAFCGRSEEREAQRSFFTFEEAFIGFHNRPIAISAGYHLFDWSFNTLFQTANSGNSPNHSAPFESFFRRGEPMLKVSIAFKNGSIEGHYMPTVVDPLEPSAWNREIQGSSGTLTWVDREGKTLDDAWHTPQWALSMNYQLNNTYLRGHYLDHISRQFAQRDAKGRLLLAVKQYGFSLQHTFGSVALTADILYRSFTPTMLNNISYKLSDQIVVATGLTGQHQLSRQLYLDWTLELMSMQTDDDRINFGPYQHDVVAKMKFSGKRLDIATLLLIDLENLRKLDDLQFVLTVGKAFLRDWRFETRLQAGLAPSSPQFFQKDGHSLQVSLHHLF